ncbi:MAG: flagellar biosynthetic protein FliR [Spirochaetales bacterium]|nr:flagellar biosynthetic protein FliR [Spirochaetales bacterium]
MIFGVVVLHAQIFLLVFARIYGMLSVAPLLSSSAVPRIARIALSLMTAVLILPWTLDYPLPGDGLSYALLIVGEAFLGLLMGFFLSIIYSAFLLSGQFFSLQMGFGASQVYDPLAQVQIPLMGQFLNIIAMLVFVTSGGFQKIFLSGLLRSFETVRAVDFAIGRDYLFKLFLHSMGGLFEQALIIAFPILGTLFLVSVSVGLLAKAAPQMNLLMLGFPIAIIVAFLLLVVLIPYLMETFQRIIDGSFYELTRIISRMGGAE